MTTATFHGGHESGQQVEAEILTPRMMGTPRTWRYGHYEWDSYELKQREDGTWIYLYVYSAACCYESRMPAQQPVPMELR